MEIQLFVRFVYNYAMVAGATVHMVCRNPERGEQAKQDIISESGNDVSEPDGLWL